MSELAFLAYFETSNARYSLGKRAEMLFQRSRDLANENEKTVGSPKDKDSADGKDSLLKKGNREVMAKGKANKGKEKIEDRIEFDHRVEILDWTDFDAPSVSAFFRFIYSGNVILYYLNPQLAPMFPFETTYNIIQKSAIVPSRSHFFSLLDQFLSLILL